VVSKNRKFKDVLGLFGTGVTVVTTKHKKQFYGITVNAFSSVSLEPPLVLVCIDSKTTSYKFIDKSKIYAVNILSSKQRKLSDLFSKSEDKTKLFDELDYFIDSTGAPILSNSLGYVDCKVIKKYRSGDHHIFIGRVQSLNVFKQRKPLLYYRGKYNSFK